MKPTPKAHLFKPGVSGNPAGRPKGSRHKLGALFLENLCADFEKHGVKAIETVRKEKPADYLKVIARLLPQELVLKDATLDEMSDDEIINTLASVRQLLAENARKDATADTAKAGGKKQPTGVRTQH